jgi:3-dehydroquinate synthetase
MSELSKLDYDKFSRSLSKDKKNTNMELVLILPKSKGLEIVKIPFNQNALEVARVAMRAGVERVIDEIC